MPRLMTTVESFDLAYLWGSSRRPPGSGRHLFACLTIAKPATAPRSSSTTI